MGLLTGVFVGKVNFAVAMHPVVIGRSDLVLSLHCQNHTPRRHPHPELHPCHFYEDATSRLHKFLCSTIWCCSPLTGSMRAAAVYHTVDEGMAEGAVVGE